MTDKELERMKKDGWASIPIDALLALRKAVRREREIGKRKDGSLHSDLKELKAARALVDRLADGGKE